MRRLLWPLIFLVNFCSKLITVNVRRKGYEKSAR